jgi:hypothetical protein
MTRPVPRPAHPRRLSATLLTGAALGLAVSTAGVAGPDQGPALIAKVLPERLWLAQAEGGEGGEAGAVAGAAPDVAYLAQLAIVQGHLAAAAALYRKGLVDEAIGLSYHPEAEMMDEVREGLAARGMADISPSMTAFSETMERGAGPDEVDAALAAVAAAVAAAGAPVDPKLRDRFDAVVVLLRAAAAEYAESTEGGTVGDVTPYFEAYGFVSVARDMAAALAAVPDARASAAGTKALDALAGADEAFGDLATGDPVARDPAILLAVAARVELIASSVH